MGKETQYNASGKLKNQVITPKYDEFEMTNIITDSNWKKLGMCEIECLSCINYTPATKTKEAISIPDDARKDEINAMIKKSTKAGTKPKTSAQKIEEQSEMMAKMAQKIEDLEKAAIPVKTPGRLAMESKATELKIKFRENIGDAKLLEKIQAIEPEFTV